MRPVLFASTIVALASWSVGCTTGVTADQACTDSATTMCAKVDQCTLDGTATNYGSLAACVQRVHDRCVDSLNAPGTGNNPDHVESCSTALPGETCQSYLQGNPVTQCVQVTGNKANAAPCQYPGQCVSGFCAIPTGVQCGTCADVPAIGASCTESGCGPDQVCAPDKTCQSYVATSGTCDGVTHVCAPHSVCVIPAAATTGTCQVQAATVGATCDTKHQTGPSCDGHLGLFCTKAGTCAQITYVGAGTACGSQSTGTAFNACSTGSSCFAQVSGSQCVAYAADGAACDTAAGPGCAAPARCITGGGSATSGTCSLPTSSLCQ